MVNLDSVASSRLFLLGYDVILMRIQTRDRVVQPLRMSVISLYLTNNLQILIQLQALVITIIWLRDVLINSFCYALFTHFSLRCVVNLHTNNSCEPSWRDVVWWLNEWTARTSCHTKIPWREGRSVLFICKFPDIFVRLIFYVTYSNPPISPISASF